MMKKSILTQLTARATLDSTKRMFAESAIGPRSGYISGERPLPKALLKPAEKKLSEEK